MSTGRNNNLDDAFNAAESLDPDDRMRLIARLWKSLPEDYFTEPNPPEPKSPELRLTEPKPPELVGAAPISFSSEVQLLTDRAIDFARKLFRPPDTPPQEKIYSAPRRFDLATVFVVTSAYSLLFGVMSYVTGYLDLPPAVSLYVGAFITLVGVGQAVLYGGQNARVASVVAGVVLSVLWNLTAVVWPPRGLIGVLMLFLLPFYAALGAGCGYIAGVLVGGVFLVADKLRTYFSTRLQASEDEHAELSDIDADRESHVAN
jgi:hypothetical protein